MLSYVLEALGFALVIVFAYLVWPPSSLLVAGAGLIVAGVAVGR